MHTEAWQWVESIAGRIDPAGRVMDQGGRNVNGSIRPLFRGVTDWVSVDMSDGPGVDVVADCGDYVHPEPRDIVVCTELLEHTPRGPDVVRCAYESLVDGGHYILTTAAPGRPPHGAHGSPWLEPGEHYRNIEPGELSRWLYDAGFQHVVLDLTRPPSSIDVRIWARKPFADAP